MRHLLSIASAVITAVAAVFPSAVTGQTYPDRPVKLILPFPAGSATDGASRVIAEELRKSLGQPVIIENLAGGDGIVDRALGQVGGDRRHPDGGRSFH